MKITITPTAHVASLDLGPCRLWTGVDENGVAVNLWIRAVQPPTHSEALLAPYDEQLSEQGPPEGASVAEALCPVTSFPCLTCDETCALLASHCAPNEETP